MNIECAKGTVLDYRICDCVTIVVKNPLTGRLVRTNTSTGKQALKIYDNISVRPIITIKNPRI